MRKKLFSSIVWVVALLAGGRDLAWSHDPKPSVLEKGAPRRQVHLPIKDFSLTDHEGRAFEFGALKGKLVVVGFIYTSCPDVCPLITSSMRAAQRSLNGKERKSVYFLSITTDPEIDSPEVLKSYGRRYEVDFSNWSFLTGDLKALAPVWKAFGVKVERKARGLVNHTALAALIDGGGVMRFAYLGTSPDPKKVVQDMRALFARP
ncbi:MAG: SCO family protein [Deltaproteobacteria bacterium]|nr:SCO family protein [Deltaproteobacteria bacterium]